MREPLRNARSKARVFISYSRRDLEFVDQLQARLDQQDIEALVDRDAIEKAEDWWARIQQLIVQSDTIVFVLSASSLSSSVCEKEVEFAESLNKRIIPIVIGDLGKSRAPEPIARLNYIFFVPISGIGEIGDFDTALGQLVQALNQDIAWIREHTRLGELARRWAFNNKQQHQLLRGNDIDAAESWASYRSKDAPPLTDELDQFISTSRHEENLRSRRARRLRLFISFLSIFAILGSFAWWKQDLLREKIYWHLIMQPEVLTPDQEKALVRNLEFAECKHGCPIMIVIPPGQFNMGSPVDSGYTDEQPQHSVRIGYRFAVSKFEITFGQWRACVDAGVCAMPPDNGWGQGNRPVINVSWHDAKRYASWLSKLTGRTYRLLSEAEWEYAARAGSSSAYPWGDKLVSDGEAHANCFVCGGGWSGQTAPVGSFPPNSFGLHDMHGNAWEWVQDGWNSGHRNAPGNGLPRDARTSHNKAVNMRVRRGGSWFSEGRWIRSAARSLAPAGQRYNQQGFRIARSIDPAPTPHPPRHAEVDFAQRSITLRLQRELRRVGCDPVRIDGKWGATDVSAIRKFNLHAKQTLSTSLATPKAVAAVKKFKERVCPLECAARYQLVDNVCVPRTCPSDHYLNFAGSCRPKAICPDNTTAASMDVWPNWSIPYGKTVVGQHPCGREIQCTVGPPRTCSWL